MRTYNGIGIMLAVACIGWISEAEGEQKSDTPEKMDPPRIVIVIGKDKTLRYGKEDGSSMIAQSFVFDQEKETTGSAAGPATMTIGNVPVPVSFRPGGGTFSVGGSLSAVYANTIWDVKAFANLMFGSLYSTRGERIASISMIPADETPLYMSSDYIVYPENDRQIDKKGPFATVVFTLQEPKEGSSAATVRLSIKRNGKSVSATSMEKGKNFRVDLDGVRASNDVLEWSAEDTATKTTCSGALGFPVRAAKPDLVSYHVIIMLETAKQK